MLRSSVFVTAVLFSATALAQNRSYSGTTGSDPLSQLLTRNAWCGFTYNQRSGASTRERVVFHGNGRVVQESGAETYSSGRSGTVAGQYGGGKEYMVCK
jgi:hypothetical protein